MKYRGLFALNSLRVAVLNEKCQQQHCGLVQQRRCYAFCTSSTALFNYFMCVCELRISYPPYHQAPPKMHKVRKIQYGCSRLKYIYFTTVIIQLNYSTRARTWRINLHCFQNWQHLVISFSCVVTLSLLQSLFHCWPRSLRHNFQEYQRSNFSFLSFSIEAVYPRPSQECVMSSRADCLVQNWNWSCRI